MELRYFVIYNKKTGEYERFDVTATEEQTENVVWNFEKVKLKKPGCYAHYLEVTEDEWLKARI